MKRKNHKTEHGFTLIELMITVSIVGILLGIGVPSFRDMMSNNRVSAATNDFLMSVHLTRSEAIKRGSRVAMCRSSNATTCSGSGDWSIGWVVFDDQDGDGLFAVADIIQVHEALSTGTTLTGGANTNSYLSFIGDGSAQKADGTRLSGTLTLSLDSKNRNITLSSVGRLSVSH